MTTTPQPGAETTRVVVVGAGHAAVTLAGLLRQAGHRGEIILLGDEPDQPYQRPPLSKKFTDGEPEQWLRPPGFYREQGITLRLGEQVTSIDPAAQRVGTATERSEGYDVLVLATGARPRVLPVPGSDLSGVGTLRTLEDARMLRRVAPRGSDGWWSSEAATSVSRSRRSSARGAWR